ncbi:MAG: hypothetical protein QW203_07830 [Thermoplasmatales archaeon]
MRAISGLSKTEREKLFSLPDLREVAEQLGYREEYQKQKGFSVYDVFTIEEIYTQGRDMPPWLLLRSKSGREYLYLPSLDDYLDYIKKVLVEKGNPVGRKIKIRISFGMPIYHPGTGLSGFGYMARSNKPFLDIAAISDQYGNFK